MAGDESIIKFKAVVTHINGLNALRKRIQSVDKDALINIKQIAKDGKVFWDVSAQLDVVGKHVKSLNEDLKSLSKTTKTITKTSATVIPKKDLDTVTDAVYKTTAKAQKEQATLKKGQLAAEKQFSAQLAGEEQKLAEIQYRTVAASLAARYTLQSKKQQEIDAISKIAVAHDKSNLNEHERMSYANLSIDKAITSAEQQVLQQREQQRDVIRKIASVHEQSNLNEYERTAQARLSIDKSFNAAEQQVLQEQINQRNIIDKIASVHGDSNRREEGRKSQASIADERGISSYMNARANTPSKVFDFKKLSFDAAAFRKNIGLTTKNMDKLTSTKNMFSRWSWSFTMLAMSSLGVYFSMWGLINALKMGVSALVAPVMDLNSAFTSLAMAEAFGGEQGQELNKAFEDLGGADALVTLWSDMQGIVANLQAALLILAIQVLPQIIPVAQEVTDLLIEKFKDPTFIDAIVSVITAFLLLVPVFLDMIPIVAELIKWLDETGLLGTLMQLMLLALIMMPVLSALSAVFSVLSFIVNIAQVIFTALGISIGEGGVAGLLSILGQRVAFLFGPIGILIGIVLAIITYFGWWDDILRVLGRAFEWFATVLQPVFDLLSGIAGALSGVGDWLGYRIFGSDYTPAGQDSSSHSSSAPNTSSDSSLPVTTSNVTNYNFDRTVIGNEELLDMINKNMSRDTNYTVGV